MERIYINDLWRFCRCADGESPADAAPGESVRLPHTAAFTPYNMAGTDAHQGVFVYERIIEAPLSWSTRRVFITFEGAAHRAEAFLNGEHIASHKCGYTAFTSELTRFLVPGADNILRVVLDSRESLAQPPFGGAIDYLTYSGLYREAYIELAGDAYIEDVFATSPEIDTMQLAVTLDGDMPEGARLGAELFDADGTAVFNGEYAATESCTVITEKLMGITPWSVSTPALYALEVSLLDASGGMLDKKRLRMGFRTVLMKADGLYLNGEKLKLLGLDRHQCYPYTGYAVPRSLQRMDADILKRELGLNCVRTSHYPQSQYFIDRCDELGLLVFMEIPGWQHIGGEEWKNTAVENVREMVLQYRNHPSVFAWGVRINESADDDEFYARTNSAAHELDPTRPTGGVRNFKKSKLLEDFYTYNDFSHTGANRGLLKKRAVTPDVKKGYLVTEYNGHMFPTKAYDDEAHRLSHALRHASVLESMYASRDIAGCIGWCMADYNTHDDFGSGDGVCYHGVMDMFRNPKLASAVYASQSEGAPVMELSSSMDIGEHPAGVMGEIYAFTNCDSVRLYCNGELVREFFPDRKRFGHMPHPPVVIDDLVGGLVAAQESYPPGTAAKISACLAAAARCGLDALPLKHKLTLASLMLFKGLKYEEGVRLYGKYVGGWGAKARLWRFEGMKDGAAVAARTFSAKKTVSLRAQADHTQMREDSAYDMAFVRITAVDGYENRLPYVQEPVELICEGPIELVGPDIVSLRGGAAGAYVKTTGRVGDASLILRTAFAQEVRLDFTVLPKK